MMSLSILPVASVSVAEKPDVHPVTGRVKNYKVVANRFGKYARGQVVPRSAIINAAGVGASGMEEKVIADTIRRRIVEETYETANCHIYVAPVKKPEEQILADTTIERNSFEARCTNLERQMELLVDKADNATKLLKIRDDEIIRQVNVIAELQGQIDDRDKLIASQNREIESLTGIKTELESELEQATQPAAKE